MRLKTHFFGLATVAALALGASSAQAETVTYTTTGMFNGLGSSIVVGGYTLTYIPVPVNVVDVPPASFGSLGQIQVTGAGPAVDLSGIVLNVTVNQTTPTMGSTVFTGVFTGQISATNSNAFVDFEDTVEAIGLVTYTITNNADAGPGQPPVQGRINLNTANEQPSAINGQINAVPEPSTMVLVGLGLPALVVMGLRRRKATAV